MTKLSLLGQRLRVTECGGALVLAYETEDQKDICCGCCWEGSVTFEGGSGPFRECDPQVKETKTLTIPESVCIPACAWVTWSTDDDAAINGVRLNGTDAPNEYCPYGGPGCCASSGTKRVCITSRSLSIDLIDTVGVGWGGWVVIKICPKQDCECEETGEWRQCKSNPQPDPE